MMLTMIAKRRFCHPRLPCSNQSRSPESITVMATADTLFTCCCSFPVTMTSIFCLKLCFAVPLLRRTSLRTVRERPIQRFAHEHSGTFASVRKPSFRDRAPPSTSARLSPRTPNGTSRPASTRRKRRADTPCPCCPRLSGPRRAPTAAWSPRPCRATRTCAGSRVTFRVPRRSRQHAARPRRRRPRRSRARHQHRRTRMRGPVQSSLWGRPTSRGETSRRVTTSLGPSRKTRDAARKIYATDQNGMEGVSGATKGGAHVSAARRAGVFRRRW